jgi:hypothetical protein
MLGLQARAKGDQARPNLAISKADLNMGRELARGAQSSVMEGNYEGKPGVIHKPVILKMVEIHT